MRARTIFVENDHNIMADTPWYLSQWKLVNYIIKWCNFKCMESNLDHCSFKRSLAVFRIDVIFEENMQHYCDLITKRFNSIKPLLFQLIL